MNQTHTLCEYEPMSTNFPKRENGNYRTQPNVYLRELRKLTHGGSFWSLGVLLRFVFDSISLPFFTIFKETLFILVICKDNIVLICATNHMIN